MQENKEYTTPELVVYGNVEELTKGLRDGPSDLFFGNDGRPNNPEWFDKVGNNSGS